MLFDPPDTLAYYGSRSLCANRDMSFVQCSAVAKAISANMNAKDFKMSVPEQHALWFYFMNHGKSVIAQKYHPLEPLGAFDKDFVERYHKYSNDMAIRAFYYMLLICIRETRHVYNPANLTSGIAHQFGMESAQFNLAISNSGSVGAYKRFLQFPPKACIGDFVKSLRHIFYKGNFSLGFGGPAWGKVADCLCNFVVGTYSAEVMLDTVWTLCHNNGAIFNKGMFYGQYTHTLYRILDIQRSGQIAEACMSDPAIDPFVTVALIESINGFKIAHPGAFGAYVDWYAVEAHGAVHGPYPNEKKQQAQQHGLGEKHIAMMTALEKNKMADAAVKAQLKANFAKTHFEYWPGQYAPIKQEPKARAA